MLDRLLTMFSNRAALCGAGGWGECTMSWDFERSLKIAFVGTGAQGASIGADFALAGLDVTFIEQWPTHVDAMNLHGITVKLATRTINAKVPALHLCQVA